MLLVNLHELLMKPLQMLVGRCLGFDEYDGTTMQPRPCTVGVLVLCIYQRQHSCVGRWHLRLRGPGHQERRESDTNRFSGVLRIFEGDVATPVHF